MSDAKKENAIEVKGVYKDFKLPHLKKNTLKSVFTGIFDKSSKHKNYESQHALKNISFNVKKGEFFGIVGRNGSGKSTLLKILAGIYQPTNGNVKVKGKLVPFIELGVGFNPELTGRENVYLNGSLLNFSKKEIDEMYEEIVDFAELRKFMDQKLKNYSSGMQVRLAFSMAIRANADILLVDEVLAVGDADFQRKCFSYFKQLKKNKKTVVFVTHDMNAVREYCDRAILINESQVVTAGSAKEVATSYTRLFTHEASTNSSTDKKSKKSLSKRWGDGTAHLREEEISVTEEKVTFQFDVFANSKISDAVIGFSIKDTQGLYIVATNTTLIGGKKIDIGLSDKLRFIFEVPNYFKDGNYTIDLAVVYDDGITVRDWWEDAISFTVSKETQVPSLTNPPIVMNVIGDKHA